MTGCHAWRMGVSGISALTSTRPILEQLNVKYNAALSSLIDLGHNNG